MTVERQVLDVLRSPVVPQLTDTGKSQIAMTATECNFFGGLPDICRQLLPLVFIFNMFHKAGQVSEGIPTFVTVERLVTLQMDL